MLIKLPIFWVVTLNIAGWLVIQIGLAWLFLRLPVRWFERQPSTPPGRGDFFYEHILFIKSWKSRLPDAARWFGGGFAKGALAGKNPGYLRRFVVETRRGELCHWLAIASTPLFLIWNPWWGGLVNLGYALAANLPCILAQRYNRARLLKLLSRNRAE